MALTDSVFVPQYMKLPVSRLYEIVSLTLAFSSRTWQQLGMHCDSD